MDNPFIGLDAPTRELLFSLLDRLTKMSSVQIILVLSMLDDIPSFITHVIPVDKMTVYSKMERLLMSYSNVSLICPMVAIITILMKWSN